MSTERLVLLGRTAGRTDSGLGPASTVAGSITRAEEGVKGNLFSLNEVVFHKTRSTYDFRWQVSLGSEEVG